MLRIGPDSAGNASMASIAIGAPVFDTDAVAYAQIPDAGLGHGLVDAVVQPDAKAIGILARIGLADLMSDRSAADGSGNGGNGVSRAAADLMANDPADDAADDGPGDGVVATPAACRFDRVDDAVVSCIRSCPAVT